MKNLLYIVIGVLLFSCGNSKQEKSNAKQDSSGDVEQYRKNFLVNTEFITYNQYATKVETGNGVQVAGKIVAIPFSASSDAYSIRILYKGSDIEPMSRGYLWYDITQNILLLRVSGQSHKFPDLLETDVPEEMYGLKIVDRKLQKYICTRDSAVVVKSLKMYTLNTPHAGVGTALFAENHKLAGIVTSVNIDGKTQKVVYPAYRLKAITDNLADNFQAISKLRFKTDKVYPDPEDVKSFIIETTMGNIEIKLSDKLPEYEKNFIRLSSDGYYDSLLIHRVLRNFLIQTGAADTRYAKKDDPVGWKGPGYTLPTEIIPGLYHKRGAVAASKLPEYKNKYNRSDGSQFFIIAGRIFSNDELDEIENVKKIKFTPDQRKMYTTVGGAPVYDGDFTVFGEVVNGMNVVDSIAAVATNDKDRPLKDIRIKKIRIIEK
ncbi:peptidylprolyl isomerase [Saccharicrinis sp. FJH54]|uniref:peptidylprolyl isomerase n=1 Tax=Saccharicrinis sp. FJH54 TaxID=3344665 RepID=UPI0035D47F3C